MANTFLSPTTIASTGLELLRRDIVLPMTVRMTEQADYSGKVGDTINIRKSAVATGRNYTDTLRTAGTPIVIDDLTETSVPLVLDNHIYSGTAVTDEQLTLRIVDFAKQVLYPQVVAVAEAAESVLVTKMNAVTGTITALANGSDVFKQVLQARKVLNQQKVPLADRWLAVSPEFEAALLVDQENRLVRYESSGDQPNTALRDARIGRLYGFNVVSSIVLTAGTAIAYHREAFAMATVAPEVPAGVPMGMSLADDGLAMRWIRDYDPSFLRDRSIVSILAGAITLDPLRSVKITGVA